MNTALRSLFPSHAMVMAAGLGTRMRPLTDHLPKPLIHVAGKPLIDHALDWLSASGVPSAVVNSFYKAELLETHLAARTAPRIAVSREQALLDTGGGIAHALPLLGAQPFFSINSDVITLDGTAPALHCLAHRWDAEKMDALLLLHPVEKAIGYAGRGDFFLEQTGLLRRRANAPAAPFVFTGVQLLHPHLFHTAPDGAFSLNLLYDRQRQPNGSLPRIYGLRHEGDWLHVGDPQGIVLAEAFLESKRLFSAGA